MVPEIINIYGQRKLRKEQHVAKKLKGRTRQKCEKSENKIEIYLHNQKKFKTRLELRIDLEETGSLATKKNL